MDDPLQTRRRHKVKQPMALQAGLGAFAMHTPIAAGAGGAPDFAMREPEGRRRAVVSGSISTFMHVAVLGFFALLAYLAPPVEELIPVRIIRELPGSDVEPAPAPKLLKPRQARAPVSRAQKVAARAVTQPRVVPVQAQQLQMKELNKVAPQQIQRRQVVSRRAQAQSVNTIRIASDVDLSKLQAVTVQATDVNAPVLDYDGPRVIDPSAQAAMPEDFAELPDVAQAQYRSAAPLSIEMDADSADIEVFEIDSDMGLYAGGEGTGGQGTAIGVVRCMESAYVTRYVAAIKNRTRARWQLPPGVGDDQKVQLRFVLDSSGTATRVEFVGEVDPAFGNSAVAALRAASPFPPMDDNVRCLAGKRLRATFDNPTM